MSRKEKLFAFETKYPFLYDIQIAGVPVYTCFRDGVLACLMEGKRATPAGYKEEKGRIYPRRIWDSLVKLQRFRKKQTLVFTSAMYRRDEGRNLAAEYLMDIYPDAVVFEWPSRNEAYDNAYFADPQRDKYCPVELYLILYKAYRLLNRKKRSAYEAQQRQKLRAAFDKAPVPENDGERWAIAYLLQELPRACADTRDSHTIFRWLFRGYKNVEYAIDFWGSARENIIPILPGKPESIELQHGIITAYHTGYIYPAFVKNCNTPFFRRKLLVYGEETKRLLCEKSIFSPHLIEAIGNPRIKMYKKTLPTQVTERKQIMFASQTYEQDGTADHYYDTVIPVLKEIESMLLTQQQWAGYTLAIKLHPRENNTIKQRYQEALPNSMVYGNSSQLFEMLSNSFVQLTVSSTTLYEAAEFDTPTVTVQYNNFRVQDIYGFETMHIATPETVAEVMGKLLDKQAYQNYLTYLKEKTTQYR